MVISVFPLDALKASAEIGENENYYSGTWLDNDADGKPVYDISWYDTQTANTYEIKTAAALAGLSYLVDKHKDEFVGKTVRLTADIDLAGREWVPIDLWNAEHGSRGAASFRGTFDGNGKTVKNMTITRAYNGEVGLFGRCDGFIKDLTIDAASIKLEESVARKVSAAAFIAGAVNNCTVGFPAKVEDCKTINSTLSAWDIPNVDYYVGKMIGGTISGCSNSGCTFTDSGAYTSWDKIYNFDFLYNYDKISVFHINTEGDLATVATMSRRGKDFSGKTISLDASMDMSAFTWVPFGNLNSVKIFGNGRIIKGLWRDASNESVAFISQVGGRSEISGLNLDVNFKGNNTAGLVAVVNYRAKIYIRDCAVFGEITGWYITGGILASGSSAMGGEITNCVNYARVSGNYDAGGICGWVDGYDRDDGDNGYFNIYKCINYGSVSSSSIAGGIVGKSFGRIHVDTCASLMNATIEGKAFAGGIIGFYRPLREGGLCAVKRSFCTSSIYGTGDTPELGGLVNIKTNDPSTDKDYRCSLQAFGNYFGGKFSFEKDNSNNYVWYHSRFIGELYSMGKGGTVSTELHHNRYLRKATGGTFGNRDYNLWEYGKESLYSVWGFIYDNGSIKEYKSGNNYGGASDARGSQIGFANEMNKTGGGSPGSWTSAPDFNDGLPYFENVDVRGICDRPYRIAASLTGSTKPNAGLNRTPYNEFDTGANQLKYPENGFVLRLDFGFVGVGYQIWYSYLNFGQADALKMLHTGDKITMYTLAVGRTQYLKSYTYTISDETFTSNKNIYLQDFLDEKGNSYNRISEVVHYFHVSFAEGNEPEYAAETDTAKYNITFTQWDKHGNQILKTPAVEIMYQHQSDRIRVELNPATNGGMSFPDLEGGGTKATGYASAGGVKVLVVPNEGYAVKKLLLRNIDTEQETEITGVTKSGGAFVVGEKGNYTVTAEFEVKTYEVIFNGENCQLCDETGEPIRAIPSVLHGGQYKFKLRYDDEYEKGELTVNGAAMEPDQSGVYTASNVSDAVRIVAVPKAVDGFEPVKGKHYTVSTNDWTNQDFTVTALQNYQLSVDKADWSETLVRDDETEKGELSFYVKNIRNGAVSLIKTELYKIDKTNPAGSIAVGKSIWSGPLNGLNFTLAFNGKQLAVITSADKGSGIKSIEYYITGAEVADTTGIEPGEWKQYKKSFTVKPKGSYIVYARITDNAGNVTVVNTNGFVVNDAVVNTGDTFSPALWLTLIALSAGALLTTASIKRKKNNE